MGTYKDFLQNFGISHGIFIIILVVMFLLLSFLVLLSKLGFLSRITFKQVTIPKCKFLYKKYSGSYEHINAAFQQILAQTNTAFKFSDSFGIYYSEITNSGTDDEEEQLNRSEAAIGIIVKEIQQEKIKLMLKKFPDQYKVAETPVTICVGTKYPYFNTASLVLMMNRVYPRLAEFLSKKKLAGGPGVLEIYSINDPSPHINILVPLQNMDKFIFK